MGKRPDMNGLWTGWYDYTGFSDPVPFTAWFDDVDGRLSGTMLEPNTFAEDALEDLEAQISGERGGLVISFDKTYCPDQGAHGLPIRYEGHADSDFEMVVGEWHFELGGYGSGRFQLSRASRGLSEGILRRVLATAGDDRASGSR